MPAEQAAPGSAETVEPTATDTPASPVGPLTRRMFRYRYFLLALYVLGLSGCFIVFLVSQPLGLSTNLDVPFWFVAICTTVLLLLQAAFLAGAPHWRWPRPTRRRPIAVSLAAGSLIATLLSAGVALAGVSLFGTDLEQVTKLNWLLLLFPVGAWAGWFALFAWMWRAEPAAGFRRVYRVLLAGSWLEMLITIPVDVQVRKRTQCYCSEGSCFALAIGIAVVFWAFGPGIVLLFLTRRLQRCRELRMCIECGYDLRGLTEPRCPECGQPFERRILAPAGGTSRRWPDPSTTPAAPLALTPPPPPGTAHAAITTESRASTTPSTTTPTGPFTTS